MRADIAKLIEVGYDQGFCPNSQAPVQSFAITTNCGDVMFVNVTNANGGAGFTVLVQGMPLVAGASITFGVNSGEIQTTPLYVTTPNPVTNAGVYVFKKQYK